LNAQVTGEREVWLELSSIAANATELSWMFWVPAPSSYLPLKIAWTLLPLSGAFMNFQ
jgi:hypothetical protein